MILSRSFINQRIQITVMQVAAVYQVDGALELDVLDAGGRLFEGVSYLSLGGGVCEVSAPPTEGAEVLTVILEGGGVYILGCLNESPIYQDQRTLNAAGEYIERVAIGDSVLQSGEARVLVAQDLGVYITPKLRAQGALEISSGGAPVQSVAIGEPVLSALDAYQQTLSELKSSVEQLQSVASRLTPLFMTASAAATTAGDLQLAQDLAEQATIAAGLPSNIITPPPIADRAILSEIAKIER